MDINASQRIGEDDDDDMDNSRNQSINSMIEEDESVNMSGRDQSMKSDDKNKQEC